MSKRNKRNRKNLTKTGRKSLKGNWGHIGAPPKPMRYPNRPFVMASLFAFNAGLCELTVRKNVDAAVAAGTLVALKPLPQKGGSVGRPKSRFVLATAFDASKMERATVKTVTTPVATVTSTPPVATVTPATSPVTEVETVAVSTPAPEPIVEAPAIPAIENAPATPAPVAELPATEPVLAPVPVADLINS